MRQTKSSQDLVWLLITLFSLLIGQWILTRAVREPGGDILAWLAVSVIVLGASTLWMGRSLRSSVTPEEAVIRNETITITGRFSLAFVGETKTDHKLRAVALLLAVVMISLLLWRIPHLKPQDNYAGVFLAWIVAILLFLMVTSASLR